MEHFAAELELHPTVKPVQMVAEEQGRPYAVLSLFPMVVPMTMFGQMP